MTFSFRVDTLGGSKKLEKNHESNLQAEKSQAPKKTRIFKAQPDQGREKGAKSQTAERAKKINPGLKICCRREND